MTLDITLTIIGTLLIIIGIIGCILPTLPGVPLNYVAILLLHFTSKAEFSLHFLLLWAIIIIIVQLLDYYIPIWGTKKLGGGKYGAWGSTIGIVAGMFLLPPWGILIFPFVGAVIGELIHGKTFGIALKAGFGAFLGFIAGTLMQLVVAIILAFYFFREAINAFM